MPDPLKSRELSEAEFNAVKKKVIDAAPDGLGEQDFRTYFGPAMEQALAEAEFSTASPEGSAVGRFASGVWENVNPVNIAKGLYQAATDPTGTVGAIVSAHGEQFGKAKDAAVRMYTEPVGVGTGANALEAQGHLMAAALPLIGPMAAKAGERIATGDIAGGMGEGAGLIAPTVFKPAVRGVGAAIPKGVKTAVSAGLESQAATRLARTITPKVGREKLRHAGTAQKVAPRLTTEPDMGALSTQQFGARVAGKLGEAQVFLDEAADARLAGKTFETKPLVEAIEKRRAELVSHAVPGEGGSVVSRPNVGHVATLEAALDELRQLGPRVSYEAIRRMRQAWDTVAEVKYNPSMTQDFLKHQSEASAAADITHALRERMAEWSPETAAANAEYSYWRKTNDLMKVLAETEDARPKVGRRLMSQLTGTLLGAKVAGTAGAITGFLAGPVAEAFVGSGATLQIQASRLMARMATAIRKGDVGSANAAAFDLKQLTKRAAVRGARAAEQATERQEQD